MKLLITLADSDSSDQELATIRQLIEVELEKCFICAGMYEKTSHLPYHCANCATLRDERWLRDLVSKARSFSVSMIGTRHAH